MEVLVIGRSCVDNIAVVEEFPAENQKRPLEFHLTEGGGQGSTGSCCIARLGGQVTYVGKVGDDPGGRFCLERLEDFGVSTAHIEIVKDGRTPVSNVFVTRSSGKRTIIYERNRLPQIVLNDRTNDLIARAPVILLDPGITYLSPALAEKKAPGSRIVYDCERWRTGLSQMMQVADYFIPSADFLTSDKLGLKNEPFETQLVRLKGMLKGELVVTRGAEGAYFIEAQDLYRVTPPDITPVDTIGAGDNFHAAFALAVSRGMTLAASVTFAVAVASLSCRDYGGRNAIPDYDHASQVAEKLKVEKISSRTIP